MDNTVPGTKHRPTPYQGHGDAFLRIISVWNESQVRVRHTMNPRCSEESPLFARIPVVRKNPEKLPSPNLEQVVADFLPRLLRR